jgi:Domain of unknown function (DUF222)
MTQPPASGSEPADEPARDSGDGRDPRLAEFGQGGAGDACPPSAALAAVVEDLSGPGWRCDGATDEELTGLLGRWEALESWAEAGKLGVIRELIRRRARPGLRGCLPMHGDLPDQWHDGMAHEVSPALGISIRAADNLIALAWDLQARLPGTGAALAGGLLSPWKAKLVSDELAVLNDELAAQAEKLILDQLTAQTTPGELGKLAAQAVVTVDPDGAAKRREYAERERARVAFWRNNDGACAMAAYGLPTDAALAANDAVETRARDYKKAKVRPDARMDQLRVLAFLDILNGITLEARIAMDRAAAAQAQAAQGQDAPGEGTQAADRGDRDEREDSDQPGADGGVATGATDRDEGNDGDGRNSDGAQSADGEDPASQNRGPAPGPVPPALTARANLTFPLATLLGLAERPGAAHGLGPLDPALVRDLAAAAANSPYSQWCLTITDADGVAVAHGCAKPARTPRAHRGKAPPASRDGPQTWAFTRREDAGPPGGYGSWALTLPGGRQLTVTLAPIPVTDCDHRYESHGYQPGDTLRHLVQIRDGTCTFPTCSRHARETDFEHAVPYDQGGRTCACNGSARSRRCHRVKQSDGWTVTQPEPGRHQWTTPSGRTYTQGPMRYPA